jgi:hypothetical protein
LEEREPARLGKRTVASLPRRTIMGELAHLVKQDFFFEKKKQKTFGR